MIMDESDAASCTASQSAFLTETQPVELTGLALHLSDWAKESLTNAGGAGLCNIWSRGIPLTQSKSNSGML